MPEAVEASFHDVAVLVRLTVRGRRTTSSTAPPGPVADLVGPLGDRVRDVTAAGSGAVAAQDSSG
ncbi:hypothetical protein ADL06_34650 [Streptomyces sp. NRRL F-6491]|nr:hypothetical protein ADL06_34650 [Streptomyces sp. NRRL F-6491]KOX35602.1 hypothetical protein ADL08_34750 [Streptomyces sp. NRRL F-6492]